MLLTRLRSPGKHLLLCITTMYYYYVSLLRITTSTTSTTSTATIITITTTTTIKMHAHTTVVTHADCNRLSTNLTSELEQERSCSGGYEFYVHILLTCM